MKELINYYYMKELINLENGILERIAKRTQKKNKSNILSKQLYNNNEDIVNFINIDHPQNESITNSYFEMVNGNILFEDIDILNLVVKYIVTCEKAIKQYLVDTYYVCDLEFKPTMAIKELSSRYYIQKYNSDYCRQIDKNKVDIELFIKLFLNIVVPYAKTRVNNIYFDSLLH